MDSVIKTAENIYRDYKDFHAAKLYTLRSGSLLVGSATPETRKARALLKSAAAGDLETFSGAMLSKTASPRRPESVAEHTEGMMHLVLSISMYREDLLPQWMLPRAIQLVLLHDAAEVSSGDIPDDGGRDSQDKELHERETISQMISH